MPVDFAFVAVGLLDGGVEDFDGCVPDVGPGAVADDEGDDWVVGDLEAVFGHGDGCGGGGGHCGDLRMSVVNPFRVMGELRGIIALSSGILGSWASREKLGFR